MLRPGSRINLYPVDQAITVLAPLELEIATQAGHEIVVLEPERAAADAAEFERLIGRGL
jgi:hypothetical protein